MQLEMAGLAMGLQKFDWALQQVTTTESESWKLHLLSLGCVLMTVLIDAAMMCVMARTQQHPILRKQRVIIKKMQIETWHKKGGW